MALNLKHAFTGLFSGASALVLAAGCSPMQVEDAWCVSTGDGTIAVVDSNGEKFLEGYIQEDNSSEISEPKDRRISAYGVIRWNNSGEPVSLGRSQLTIEGNRCFVDSGTTGERDAEYKGGYDNIRAIHSNRSILNHGDIVPAPNNGV